MNHYIYIGDINRQRIFYCVESRNLYLEPRNVTTGIISWLPVIGILTGCLGMTLLRRVNVYFVPPHMGGFVILSMIGGLAASYFLTKQVRKSEHKGFARIAPMEQLGQAELQKIFRRSKMISIHYFVGKLLMIIFVLLFPFVIVGTGSLFSVCFYPICWMCLGYLFLYFNSGKRRRAIREFREQYIQ